MLINTTNFLSLKVLIRNTLIQCLACARRDIRYEALSVNGGII